MTTTVFTQPDDEIQRLFDSRETSIAVVGFGYIGTVVGAVLADRGFQVTGIDVRADVVDGINAGTTIVREPGLDDLIKRTVDAGKLTASTGFDAVADNDVIVVTVGTPLGPDFEPIVEDIEAAANGVAKHLRPGHLVILKSTVPPHTTEDLVRPILEQNGLKAGVDFGLAFCPERLAEGRAISEFTSIPVVVGGVDGRSAEVCSLLWRSALGVESLIVDNARTAEMTKLADNLWIDLNIALANELAMVCDRLDIDAMQVIESANTLPKVKYNVNILMPSMGVGGYCLTKDPWFVQHLGGTLGLSLMTPQTSRTVNDKMPTYTYELIEAKLAAAGKPISEAKIAVLGIAFKNNTGDTRLTPTKYTVALLANTGCDLRIHDPWVTTEEARAVTNIPMTDSLEDAVRDVDAVVFLTGHRQFKEFPLDKLAKLTAPTCLFLDGRNAFDRAAVEAAGFVYKGIGR